MPLTTGELDRIKVELGFNVLNTAAQPYVGVTLLFDQVVQLYLREGLDTTTSTAVSAAPSGAAVSLTLANATGVTLHSRVAVDVDDFLEMATIRAIAGNVVTVILRKAHAGSYTVTLDGGLQQVRECLAALYTTQQLISELDGTGAIKAVDEVHFFDSRGRSRLELLEEQQRHWRIKLATCLFGQGYQGAGSSCALY